MGIYKRDGVNPEWEPVPWKAVGPQADAQEMGFHQRAMKPLVWTKVDWSNFPDEGIFGKSRDYLLERDVAYVTTFDGEDLVLTQGLWHGFPDPPEWGLLSRVAGEESAKWEHWGHFPVLPVAWRLINAV